MGDRSAIEWTDATWNPVTGCSHVSEGCRHCYAEALSLRRGWSAKPWTARNAAENVVLHPDRLPQPLRWRQPRRVFVNSMSDLFHERIPAPFLDQVFAVMAQAARHTFQVLTKRPERMSEYLTNRDYGQQPLPNVWLGVSVEDQAAVAERIPLLLQTPAAVRFISAEPLLGPLTLDLNGIDWVIVGGESGIGFRRMRPEWATDIRDQCTAADVAFLFKQWGGVTPKAGGRLLNGRTWDEYPHGKADHREGRGLLAQLNRDLGIE
jgi:protein gp37